MSRRNLFDLNVFVASKQRIKTIKIPAMVLFIDFRKAYDSASRKQLFKAMREFGVSPKLVKDDAEINYRKGES